MGGCIPSIRDGEETHDVIVVVGEGMLEYVVNDHCRGRRHGVFTVFETDDGEMAAVRGKHHRRGARCVGLDNECWDVLDVAFDNIR